MDRLKEAFLYIIALGVLFQCFFLLEFALPDLYSTRLRSTMRETHNACLEELRIRSERTKNVYDNIVMAHDVKSLETAQSLDQCYYRVQVYTNNITNINTEPKNNVSCQKGCTVEITVAGGEDWFSGMDAVVFHIWKRFVPRYLPPADMNPNQAWVYFAWESPYSTATDDYHVLVNAGLPVHAVWTYHRGSNLTYPYGYYDPRTPMTKSAKPVDEWLRGKTKFVLWVGSNCDLTSWPRTSFVRQLQEYVSVDMYGSCGNLTCMPISSAKCDVKLVRQYKFYLALENAECEDYITEKVWLKPLKQGVVPIVYGPKRKVYEELLPPNSFIYVGDYKNMSELAEYLKLLDSKPELYVQYLIWQHQGTARVNYLMYEPYNQAVFCDLIPVIDRVKRGELKRTPVGETSFPKTCRKPEITTSAFGLGNWNPW